MSYNFVPMEHQDIQIEEFDLDVFLKEITEQDVINIRIYNVRGVNYRVNVGQVRYHVFKESRTCACCGVIGNRLFLTPDVQTTQETGKPAYHMNLYAETTDFTTGKKYMVLMVRNRFEPDNPILCFHCNALRFDNMTLEQMKRVLFPAYRAFKSSQSLNRMKVKLEPYYQQLTKLRKTVLHINEALNNNLVSDEQRLDAMKEKMFKSYAEAERLEKELSRLELDSQVSGVVPDTVNIRV